MAVNPNTRPFSLKHPVRLIQNKLQSQSGRFVFRWQTTPEKQKGLLFSEPASSCQNYLAHSVQFWTENTFCVESLFSETQSLHGPCHVWSHDEVTGWVFQPEIMDAISETFRFLLLILWYSVSQKWLKMLLFKMNSCFSGTFFSSFSLHFTAFLLRKPSSLP